MPETLTATKQPTPEELAAQGYSQADIELMLANGIDPYTEAQNWQDQPAAAGYNPYETVDPIRQTEVPSDPVESLVAAETNALKQIAPDSSGISTAQAVEKVEKDANVLAARHKIEGIFGANAADVEVAATAQVIDNSAVPSADRWQIANDFAQNRSPLAEIRQEAPADEEFAQLKDKVNGGAERTVNRVARQTRSELRGFGLRGSTMERLGDEALLAGGADLTKREVAVAAEDTVIGEEVVRSLTGGKPKMSSELRETVQELASKGQLSKLQEAVANKSRSRGTLRRVGKQLRRGMRNRES